MNHFVTPEVKDSKLISVTSWCGSTSRQWYKIICTDKERKQRRVEELRKEKQDQEMAECTFRPQTITRSSKKVTARLGLIFLRIEARAIERLAIVLNTTNSLIRNCTFLANCCLYHFPGESFKSGNYEFFWELVSSRKSATGSPWILFSRWAGPW